ncbi:unnamed protein product [Lactuca saligna]|uniref:Amino acid transporter transmembrane domain-containing protein n=1 Tax=Lactuca saligna TaxID=75948 RepID=A0AA35Y8P8_LACSI|nr:unnamed protein product [Lactuca saligna]
MTLADRGRALQEKVLGPSSSSSVETNSAPPPSSTIISSTPSPATDLSSPPPSLTYELPVNETLPASPSLQQFVKIMESEPGRGKDSNGFFFPVTSSRNAKWCYSAFHNVTAMVGAGVLSLHYAVSQLV